MSGLNGPSAFPCPDLLSADDLDRLRQEAAVQWPSRRVRAREGYRLEEGWQLLGPVHSGYADGGVELRRMHREVGIRLRHVVGHHVVPTVSSYLYYEPGDHIGLHLDQSGCDYDVLALLDGRPGPLCLHPELAGMPPGELLARAVAGVDDPGLLVNLADGPGVLAGRTTPHHRQGHPGPEELRIVAFCFRSA